MCGISLYHVYGCKDIAWHQALKEHYIGRIYHLVTVPNQAHTHHAYFFLSNLSQSVNGHTWLHNSSSIMQHQLQIPNLARSSRITRLLQIGQSQIKVNHSVLGLSFKSQIKLSSNSIGHWLQLSSSTNHAHTRTQELFYRPIVVDRKAEMKSLVCYCNYYDSPRTQRKEGSRSTAPMKQHSHVTSWNSSL